MCFLVACHTIFYNVFFFKYTNKNYQNCLSVLAYKKDISFPADFALKILSGANLLEKLPSRQCNQMKQLLDACRHCLSLFEPLQCFYPSIQHAVAPASLCHTDSKEFTKTLSFHDEFHRSPCKRQILTFWDGGCSSVWKQPPRASSCSGSPCCGRGARGGWPELSLWGVARSLLAAAFMIFMVGSPSECSAEGVLLPLPFCLHFCI